MHRVHLFKPSLLLLLLLLYYYFYYYYITIAIIIVVTIIVRNEVVGRFLHQGTEINREKEKGLGDDYCTGTMCGAWGKGGWLAVACRSRWYPTSGRTASQVVHSALLKGRVAALSSEIHHTMLQPRDAAVIT